MKKNIHPKYYNNVNIKCVCGSSFIISSTKEVLETEVCSKCHPFYTGKKVVLDIMGNIEKFNKRMAKKVDKKIKRERPIKKNNKLKIENT